MSLAWRSGARAARKKWELQGVERLGLFKPQSRIRSPPTLSRELKPFYLRLQELEHRQNRGHKNPWTDELGKQVEFRYPIDNERDRAKTLEKGVTFADHIDFDDSLQWVPRSGPVAAFMDIIVLGLSKNHTKSVAEKREILNNFRLHFANFVDDDHLFPPEDVERAREDFAKIEGDKPLLRSHINEMVYEKGIGRVPLKRGRRS